MEWLAGILAAVAAFFAASVPSFGAEVEYVRKAPVWVPPSEVRVLFAGDVMLDRSIRAVMEKEGDDFIFSCLGDTLASADVTVVNLEGPITEHDSKSVGSLVGDINNTKFTFASTSAALLRRQGVDAVSIANNHAQDFGRAGVRSTMRFLENAGVRHFGDPLAEGVAYFEENGVSLALIGYNQFQDFSEGEWYGSTTTVEKIRAARARGSIPIVFAHWGQEYAPAGAAAKSRAREWIDAGAEFVVGAHPHVVQEHEVYAGKHIYYSLGNFIFDQYWEDTVREGLLVEVTFSAKGVVRVGEIPTYLERDRRTCLRDAVAQ